MFSMLMLFVAFSALPQGSTIKKDNYLAVQAVAKWDNNKKTPPAFVVANNLTDASGNVLIQAGTPVAIQLHSEKRRGAGKAGKIEITFQYTTAVDGQTVPLRGTMERTGKQRKGLAFGLGFGLMPVLGFFSLPCIAIDGLAAKIQQGETFNCQIADAVIVEVKQ